MVYNESTEVRIIQELWNIYHADVPDFVREMAGTPAMLRLKNIGMHCGCEYTRFENYAGARPYSRWEHSVGVALIIWNFTRDMAQAAAGLLHDIASPMWWIFCTEITWRRSTRRTARKSLSKHRRS